MKCEICDFDAETIVILNIPSKKYVGALNTFTCKICAEKSNAYCLRHKMPYLGFMDGTTACRCCIEEEVEYLGEKTANSYFCELLKYLPDTELREIHDWFEPVSKTLDEPIQKSIFRSIITYAKRHKKTSVEVIEEMIETWKCIILH